MTSGRQRSRRSSRTRGEAQPTGAAMWDKRPGTVVHGETPFNCEPAPSALCGRDIAPVDTFYSRNHGPIPDVAKDDSQLTVGGMVATPLTLSLGELTHPFPTHARAWDSTGSTQPESAASLWNPKGYANNSWAHVDLDVT